MGCEGMKEISKDLAQTPLGKILVKALETVAALPPLAEPLFAMQEQLLPRMKSRMAEFTLSAEALAAFAEAQATPHVISLARSHNWYAPALQPGFKLAPIYTIDDLRRESSWQLAIRQGIAAKDSQFDIARISTMQMSRAIIRTTKPGTAVLGETVAWDGYNIPPALEQRQFSTKPEGQSWREYIGQNFANPAQEVGAIFITSPHSLTGKLTDPAVLKELLEISDEYGIKLVLNQVHATPGHDGQLPEPQTRMIAGGTHKNLVIMTSATKQLMPYAVAGLEGVQLNIFYTPDAAQAEKIREEISKTPSAAFNRTMIAPGIVGPAVELLKASGHDFFVGNQKQSHNKRLVIDKWLAGKDGVEWYNGEMPDTTYHAVLTFDHALLAKNGVKAPHQLYDYILFTTGLDVAPIFDSGPGGAKNAAGDVSFRMNYSLPDKELNLSLKLLGVAVDKLKQGMTLDQVYEARHYPGPKLRADGMPLSNAQPVPAKPVALKAG